jgi:hypothetical protein
MFPTRFDFPEDLQMDLPFHPDKKWIKAGREFLHKLRGVSYGYMPEGTPPLWKPGSWLEKSFFKIRDNLINRKVYDFIEKNNLKDFDIYHLESGNDFFRDSRFMKQQKKAGKKIVCFYHGTDVINRGVIKEIHELSDLNLTSELDLLDIYPGLKYLFLPIDTDSVVPVPHDYKKIKIAHAVRIRTAKGSDFIIDTVKKLEQKYPVELVLMENLPHREVMRIKQECDIYVDQIADKGGWGYGMSSVESFAQGLAVCSYLNQKYVNFIPDHPFINVNYDNLENELIKLIQDKDYRLDAARKGRDWVVKTHDYRVVTAKLYDYYKETGIIS